MIEGDIPGVTKHARERMIERYGEDLTRDEWLKVVADILEGRCLLIRNQDAGRGMLYAATIRGRERYFMWVPIAGAIITVTADGRARVEHSFKRLRSSPRKRRRTA